MAFCEYTREPGGISMQEHCHSAYHPTSPRSSKLSMMYARALDARASSARSSSASSTPPKQEACMRTG
eukprot:11165315-Lingulodinium_polyedra.AAC.1